jgi:regulator of nucleoside diphosphate kinase
MKYKKLIVAQSEVDIIRELMSKVHSKDLVHDSCYSKLRAELTQAKVMPDEDMPADLVRLGSFVDVDTPFGLMAGYQLVLPKESDPKQKKLSILTPMGSALIGYAVGDEVQWSFPAGEKTITIKKVYTENEVTS